MLLLKPSHTKIIVATQIICIEIDILEWVATRHDKTGMNTICNYFLCTAKDSKADNAQDKRHSEPLAS